MPLSGAYHVSEGDAVLLADLVQAGGYKQIDIFGNEANQGTFYIGPASVESDGTNAFLAIGAGKSWGSKAADVGQIYLNANELYVIGTEDDKLHISLVR